MKQRKTWTVWPLLGMLWVLVLAGASFSSPVQAWLATLSAPTDFGGIEYDPTLDPRKGSRVALPQVDAFGRELAAGNKGAKALLVLCGPCSECSLNSLKPEWISGTEFERIILIYTSPPAEIPRALGRLPKRFRVLSDARSELHHRLNAAWRPRFYLVDSEFRLLKLHESAEVVPDFVTVVRDL